MEHSAPIRRNHGLDDVVIQALREIVGDRLSTASAILEQHGRDESWHNGSDPDAVVFAHSTEEVSEVVKVCAKYKVPIIPFGTGTSLEGGVVALKGGVSIDLMQMDKILSINVEDLDVTVQPGVTRKRLNSELRDTGLFFPVDPGADASLGGMTATRASGTNAVRYGTMRENVISLVAVMADGKIIRTSKRVRKSAAGYDLTRLLVGSEGTLGVITEITLRLYGIPESISAAVCPFPDMKSAVDTVISIIQCGIPIARIELVDDVMIDAINKYSNFDHAVQPTLFFEFHGSENGVIEQVEMAAEIAKDNGCGEFQWETKTEGRTRLWQARHDAYYAALAMRPNKRAIATDVCVPISRLADCILETREDITASGLYVPIVGHVGDGNFHLTILVDVDDPEELAKAHELDEKMVMRALAMDGTCTGEHGIGFGKMDFLVAEHGEAISVMRAIKIALDPQNIMNPGKIIRI